MYDIQCVYMSTGHMLVGFVIAIQSIGSCFMTLSATAILLLRLVRGIILQITEQI